MSSLVLSAVLAVLLVTWLLARRANELCVLRVEDGACHVASGRAPGRFVDEVDDIVRRAGVSTATLRIVVESGSPRAVPHPALPEIMQQQVRNALGQYRVVQFRAGNRVPARRSA